MTFRFLQIAALSGLSLFFAGATMAADQPSASELKLREVLRSTLIQLRDAQIQVSTLQATQQELEIKNTELTDKVNQQIKQLAEEKGTADKSIAELKDRLTQQETESARLGESLAKWKEGYAKMATLAQSTEAKRAALAEKVILQDRRIGEQQMKNDAMYKLGREVLLRYEKFGLGDALTAREPFVGITRVKFENLIQDYSDNLADQRIKP